MIMDKAGVPSVDKASLDGGVSYESISDEVLKDFSVSPYLFARHYFKHHFREESPSFHASILNAAEQNLFLAVAAPRGSAKSTILSFVRPIHKICFKKARFIVFIQNTDEKAAGSLETIKEEIRSNVKLKDFGIRLEKDSAKEGVFVHPDGFKTRVMCAGYREIGSLRGIKFGAYRPDLIIIDDLEDDELVKSPERRLQLKEDFDAAILPIGDKGTEFNFICTILHDDSLAAKMLSRDFYKQFHKMFYQIRYKSSTGAIKSIWEKKWSMDDIRQMEREDPESFAKERMNNPVSGERRQFHKEDFRYWKVENGQVVLTGGEGEVVGRYELKDCSAAIGCDLAWSEKKSADYTALVPVLITPKSEYLVDEYVLKRGMKPDALEGILFAMVEKYEGLTGRAVPVGFEKAVLEKVMKWMLRGAMQRRNKYLLFKDLLWDKDKISRIVTRLQPLYANHAIYHRRGMNDLEFQLSRIPSGKHDDLPDALAGAVQMLVYAPRKVSVTSSEDKFEWWRRQTSVFRSSSRDNYVFGRKERPLPFKVVQACP